jgi:pyridoxal phosphate enzyme (YggS family)
VRARIGQAAVAAGRDAGEVTLVVVTKTWPASDVLHLAALGIGDVGENRDQEAAPKAAEVAAAGIDVRWHFVGQLQRNKAPSVVRYASMVHSVDSVRLAVALDRAAAHAGRRLDALVQVSLDRDPHRGGAIEHGEGDANLDAVLAAVADAPALSLRGLMAVAPLDGDPDIAFAELARLRRDVVRRYPEASILSAGMSGDLEQAVRHGATHVRIGTLVLGKRPRLL